MYKKISIYGRLTMFKNLKKSKVACDNEFELRHYNFLGVCRKKHL